MAEVYWIRKQDHTDILTQGYIGVSKNALKRWKLHVWALKNSRHENPILTNAFNKYGWVDLVKEVVVVADEEYCYWLENKLRPANQIGWNLNAGGTKPPVTKPRGENYLSPLKGKKRETPWLVGRVPANKGKPLSPEHAAKLAASYTGKQQTAEHIAKRVESRRKTLAMKQQQEA